MAVPIYYYIVQASACSDFGEVTESGVLVAWKRIYIEEDKMYKTGSDLATDFTADEDSEPDTITVEDGSVFSENDSVVIFDADNPTGETRTITAISGNDITVADLTNSYNAGYSAGDKGAAVARPADGVYDANITGRDTNAFGSAANGSDGGCFVEIKILSDGTNSVPYRETFGSDAARVSFRNVWFSNKGKSNYIYVCSAEYHDAKGDNWYGVTNNGYNVTYVYLGEISDDFPSDVATVNADVTAHEIGHQFALTQVDGSHPNDIWCHEGNGTDYCLMSYQRDRTDAYSEFCYNSDPNSPIHIMDVRDASDSL